MEKDFSMQTESSGNISDIEQITALEALLAEPGEAKLWDCVVAFQSYPFYTASGLGFSYLLKRGRSGAYNKELIIDRRESSKSLTWSSIALAFRKLEPDTIYEKPKAIGDIRGISYIYPMFWRFGLIKVPEKVAKTMSGENL